MPCFAGCGLRIAGCDSKVEIRVIRGLTLCLRVFAVQSILACAHRSELPSSRLRRGRSHRCNAVAEPVIENLGVFDEYRTALILVRPMRFWEVSSSRQRNKLDLGRVMLKAMQCAPRMEPRGHNDHSPTASRA